MPLFLHMFKAKFSHDAAHVRLEVITKTIVDVFLHTVQNTKVVVFSDM